jgi:hypothetical protein
VAGVAPQQHPTQIVVDAFACELGAAFDRAKSVVHSTSWRYEGERLVLSYLAALPPLAGAPPGFVLVPVDPSGQGTARSSAPAAIPVTDVLTHGLRHLAMLRASDPSVAAALSVRWHQLLGTGTRYRPVCSNTASPHRTGRPRVDRSARRRGCLGCPV